MEVHERADGVTIVNDAYNANPESMRAALAALAAMGDGRRTWAVLGEMAELGEQTHDAHAGVGAVAAQAGVERLVVVGTAAAGIAEGAAAQGFSSSALYCVDDVDAAAAVLERDLQPGDVVLVKASRAADLQRVAERLLAHESRVGA
jgi:UDP-N-acetylmuramoyl-tripeptide--D-alanyl-D-alanine ligase